MFSSRINAAVLSRIWCLGSLIILLALALSWPQAARAGWVLNPHTLITARYQHTATILANGQILVAGGYNQNGTTNSAELYDPASGAWSPALALFYARYNHTATLLPNGQVLVAGGDEAGTVELYDPNTDLWRYLGNLRKPRSEHTATLLSDGTVLLAGGKNNSTSGILQDAEIYDPATQTSQLVAAPMASPRKNHTATLLPNGQVLLAGGNLNNEPLKTGEFFDPAQKTWTATPLMLARHANHTATLMPDGLVLVVGGNDLSDGTTAEIYDAGANSWARVAALPAGQGRQHHTATLLADGRVLVTGGDWGGTAVRNTTLIYEPNTGAWSLGDTQQQKRTYHTATLLADGKILLSGGNGDTASSTTSEFLFPATGKWKATGAFQPRMGHTATLLPASGKVLVTGGNAGIDWQVSTFGLATSQLYDPATGAWTPTGSLSTGRWNHTATLLPAGHVLVVGGNSQQTSNYYLNSGEIYDPDKGTWRPIRPMGLARANHTATLLADGKVLVAGGNYDDYRAEIYDPATGAWSYTASMNAPRISNTATLLPNGQVLVVGWGITGITESCAEVFDPATKTWSYTGSMNVATRSHTATLLPNGQVLVAGGMVRPSYWVPDRAEIYDPASGTWSLTAPMSNSRYDHTAVLLPNGQVMVAGGYENLTGYSLSSAEFYDPASGTWNPTATMTSRRGQHTATLLANGQVLVAGGWNTVSLTMSASSELYNLNLGFQESWRPVITSVQIIIPPGGLWFGPRTTDPGISFGITLANLCQDFMKSQQVAQGCQVQLLSVEDKHTINPLIDPLQSTHSFIVTKVLNGVANDLYQVTITIGGIPSLSCLIRVGPAVIPPYLFANPFMGLLLN